MKANQKREIRTLNAQEFRATKTSGGTTINGTCIVYNSLSEDLGQFRERIAPGAATASLAANDIFMFVNHDPGKVIGRTSVKTLTLREDAAGVHFECLLPDNTLGNDLKVSMERGDISSCSFGFYCEQDSWSDADGGLIRTVEKCDVFECTICAAPAYGATSAKVSRSFPDGIPAEIRAHVPNADAITERKVEPTVEKRDDSDDCQCDCDDCVAGACGLCSDDGCDDPNCEDCSMSSIRSLRLRVRLVASD